MSPLIVSLLLLGGVLAGFVNAVAGGGSVITLPILIELFGGGVANGTNRIAILLQNIAAVIAFQTTGHLPWQRTQPLILPIIFGATVGALAATLTSPEAIERTMAIAIVLVALSVAAGSSPLLTRKTPQLQEPWRSLIFFLIGTYGGFVQAGVGFLLLAGLVFGLGLDLTRGNAAKVLLILSYTPVALLLFFQADQVELLAGLLLGTGTATGAVLAALLAVRTDGRWIRWIIVGAAFLAAGRILFS